MVVPIELATDGGPSFTAYDFGQFCKQWGIRQQWLSAHHPQSNGRAEAGVKTAMILLMDNTERGGRVDMDGEAKELLQYRNTRLLGFGSLQPIKGCSAKSAGLLLDANTMDYGKRYGMSPILTEFCPRADGGGRWQ